MFVLDAYRIVKTKIKEPFSIKAIKEYKKCYAFVLAPSDSEKTDRIFIGGDMLCVDKETGKSYFDDAMRHERPIRIVTDTVLAKLAMEV